MENGNKEAKSEPTNEVEDDDEEEEIEDDQDDDDEEPKLKYQRLGSNVTEILQQDAASCLIVHDKFLALGTHWGIVYILDFYGNEIKKFTSHSTTVNELSIDDNGDYIASCSDDGKVVINGLYTDELFIYEHNRPVMSVAVDPSFSKKNTRSFAIGGRAGQLIVNSKGFFGRKDTVLHSGEGAINVIRWKNSYIAWANDVGVKVYDNDIGQRIAYIDRPKSSPRADLYRCHLCWENDTTLIVGWANCIKVGTIVERHDNVNGLPIRYIEIAAMFTTEYYVSGIAPFGEYLVCLAYLPEESETDPVTNKITITAQRPELRIITRDNQEISSDALSIKGFENCKANDYRLGHMQTESLFYIVSPHDVVVARPRDLDDHVTWLMERKRYEEALRAAEANESQLKEHKITEIGEKYIEYLVAVKNLHTAAELCPKIFKRDAALWEKWVFQFDELNQLKAICDYVPTGTPQLSPKVYEMILAHFLGSKDENDHMKFKSLVTDWPPGIYNLKTVINFLNKEIKEKSDDHLMDALAKLYSHNREYDKTLDIYLRLKREIAFKLIEEKDLFDSIRDKVLLLLQYKEEKAIQLLVNNTHRIPIDQVVAQLQPVDKRLLHLYLHQLFVKDPHAGKDYHELQIELYAQYDYTLLLPFLQQSNYYPLEKAYKVCEERNLYPEMVYIQGRMGNNKKGLKLLIEHIGDVKKAIDFIETQNDQDLWEDLIDYSMNNPKFVSDLLEHIGAYVDPLRLIKRIPSGMEILHLRDRLVKIISDYNLQMSLREGCKEILKADCVDLEDRLAKGLKRGLRVTNNDAKCAICNSTVLEAKASNPVIMFWCHHMYHTKCLRSGDTQAPPSTEGHNPSEDEKLWCTICQSQKQRTVRRSQQKN